MKRLFFFTLIILMNFPAVFPQENPGAEGTAPPEAATTPETTTAPEAAAAPGAAALPDATALPGEAAADANRQAAGTAAAESNASQTPQAETKDPEKEILELDIKTSTLMELASWCRMLGLSEGGTRADLANRLRSHFSLPATGGTYSEEEKVITIESARTTEYFTIDVVDEEYARLRGGVVISLKDGEAVHRITASEILYNRTRNVMTAQGGVEYVKTEEGSEETFKGDSITVNLDNWSSIFVDGISERSAAEGQTAYRFAGNVISRNSEKVTVLTRAEISNGANPDALWSLNASKVWLLPESDWAIVNAILKVGNIPVLWLPFFFYPSDEIVFHPVLGYRTREGTFFQTTTYVLGRPKSSGTTENSMTKIFGGTGDMEKKREGLFLRSTGKRYRAKDETKLSVLFDAYANMGAYLGTELAVPRKGVMGALDLSFGLGLTRNVYPMANAFTPFAKFDGESDWNTSWLFSNEIPLRYRFDTKSSVSGTYGSVSWKLPFYSDPYVNRDFLDRSEELDWLAMLREGASTEEEETTSTTTTDYMSSYDWTLSGSLTPKVTALNPYVSSLSVSNISSSLNFTNRDVATYTMPAATKENPDRKFFLPNKFNILSLSAAVAGTPFTFGAAPSPAPQNGAEPPPAAGDALLPSLPRSPWDDAEAESGGDEEDNFELAPPVLGQTFTAAGSGGPTLTFDYRVAPTFGSELQFRTSPTNWTTPEDIDWSEISSVLSRVSTNASMGFGLAHSGGGLYSGSFRLSGTGNWQDYTYLNEDAEEYSTRSTVTNPDGSTTTTTAPNAAAIKSALDRAHSQTSVNTTYSFTSAIKPFYRSPVWSATSVGYSFSGLLAKTEYDGTGVTGTDDNPEWDWVMGKWDKTDLSTNQANLNISANIMDYVQSLSLTHVLPPKDPTLLASAAMRAWISETAASTSILEPYDEEKREFRPLNVTETLKFSTFGSLQQLVIYDPELEEYTSLKTTFDLPVAGFNASYLMTYMTPYVLNHNGSVDPALGNGWIQITGQEKELVPQTLSFTFKKEIKKEELWNKRLSLAFSFDTSLTFDLQRYTYSSFNFGLKMTAGINNFLDLTLSASSSNSQIYRYFQDLPFFESDVPIPAGLETNIFKDLFNSFRFDDMNLRRNSGFKLKTFSMDLVHHLGDWNAKLGVSLEPYLDNTAGSIPAYKFNTQVSFLVQWVPIEEIRTETILEKDKITFK